jgi:hypothetical protein
MVHCEPKENFDAIFIIYSHLGLQYADFHAALSRFAIALNPGGLIAIGQSPADAKTIPADDPAWDETKTYVEGYNLPFWGQPFPTLLLTQEGQKKFLESIGMEVVYDTVDVFQPKNPKCDPETQQYIVAQRKGEQPVTEPVPPPKKKA